MKIFFCVCHYIKGNEHEENCFIFIFKSQVSLKAAAAANPISNNNESSQSHNHLGGSTLSRSISLLSPLHHQQQQQQFEQQQYHGSSYLIGYTQIKYYKDNYQLLCEYLFHSVYDSTSLESFELEHYLSNNIRDEQIEERDLIDQIESHHRYYHHQHQYHASNRNNSSSSSSSTSTLTSPVSSVFSARGSCSFNASFDSSYANFIKFSPFFNYYLNYLRKLQAAKYHPTRINSARLDEFLSKAYRFVRLPVDWTLLGQLCYLNKGTISVPCFVFI